MPPVPRGLSPRRDRPRPAPPSEYLYGRNAVLEALRAGRPIGRILLAEAAYGSALGELLSEARRLRVPVVPMDRRTLDQLAPDRHHQGVLAEVPPFAYSSLEDIFARAGERAEAPLVLALDALQDPQNFGTLLRAALATGVHGVLLPEHRSVGVTPAVAKASAGATEHLAIAHVTNLGRALEQLRERGVWVYGLAVGRGAPFWEVDWAGPSAVVVGSEGAGLGRLVQERCDALVHIPMAPGALQSLNAATAGSLVLYEAFRRRRA